jgi:hypothetical protein
MFFDSMKEEKKEKEENDKKLKFEQAKQEKIDK